MSDWNEEKDAPAGDSDEDEDEAAAGGWETAQDSPHEGEEGQAGDVA